MHSGRDLFDAPPLPGLVYGDDIVTADEERELLRQIAALPFRNFEFRGWAGKRRTVSFGWRYDFNDARLAPAPPTPEFLLPLRARVAALADVAPEAFEHVLVIEYGPGAGIGWHRDRPVFDRVVGVSLGAPCTLRLRRRAGKGFERASLALAPRSAYVLTGAARHEWEHSIVPMARQRYSVTFRTMTTPRARGA